MINYIVVTRGHIAQFEQSYAALEFQHDFGGTIFNMWALTLHD